MVSPLFHGLKLTYSNRVFTNMSIANRLSKISIYSSDYSVAQDTSHAYKLFATLVRLGVIVDAEFPHLISTVMIERGFP